MPTTTVKDIIEELNERVVDNCTTVDKEQRFCDMIDECYSFEKVGGIFATMTPSRVLREVDLIAYRCGLSDHEDDTLVEVNGDYYEESDADEQREELRGELDSEITDLESEMDASKEAGEEEDADDVAKLSVLKARAARLDRHAWDR